MDNSEDKNYVKNKLNKKEKRIKIRWIYLKKV